MSDNGEIEVEASGFKVLPKDVTDEVGTIKLLYVVDNPRLQWIIAGLRGTNPS